MPKEIVTIGLNLVVFSVYEEKRLNSECIAINIESETM